MKGLGLSRYALATGAAAALLAGCGGSQPPIGAPGAMPQNAEIESHEPTSATRTIVHRIVPASLEYVLYSFRGRGGPHDAAHPVASLINLGGTLYGTTADGGRNHVGTVFSVTMGGTERVLHSFGGASDGAHPYASLIDVNGKLYGSTSYGGTNNRGTVFSITTTGTEKVLYSFSGGSDGATPIANLINVKGTLYGTTVQGGPCGTDGCGTVYSVTTTGREQVLYSFRGGPDGVAPDASLINVNGTLYGTTYYGGSECASFGGCGTVYSVSTAGTEKVLYNFGGGSDGTNPFAGLINVDGTLYGTTYSGGANDDGTVFSVTAGGSEQVLHSFGGSADGANPLASLIDIKGTLYGTTFGGGANDYYGTVFSVTTTGAEQILHGFGSHPDGERPHASLINVNGKLYGTTADGGSHCIAGGGCGTVFDLSPPHADPAPPPAASPAPRSQQH